MGAGRCLRYGTSFMSAEMELNSSDAKLRGMIQISGGAMRYGGQALFEGLNWLVGPEDRIGIVGENGSGKTTLLKILAGIEHLDAGEIYAAEGLADRLSPARRAETGRENAVRRVPERIRRGHCA